MKLAELHDKIQALEHEPFEFIAEIDGIVLDSVLLDIGIHEHNVKLNYRKFYLHRTL